MQLFSDSFIGYYKILSIVLCAISRYLLATFFFGLTVWYVGSQSCVCVCARTCVCVCACARACVCVCAPSHGCLCNHMKNHEVPLSVEFSRQKYWDGCHFLHHGFFLTQGSNMCLLHWQADSFTTAPPGESPQFLDQGSNPHRPAVEVQNLNHLTAREVYFIYSLFF